MQTKCIYCDDLERAVAHTSTNSSSEMSCTINFIVPLLIKTDVVSFCETVRCQRKMEILLIGKFIRINTCRERKSGTKFSWCLERRRLLWALGDAVLLFGCLFICNCFFFKVYGLVHVEVVLFFLCLQELSSYQRISVYVTRNISFLIPHIVLAYT